MMRIQVQGQPHRYEGSRLTGAGAEVRTRPTSFTHKVVVAGPNPRYQGAGSMPRTLSYRRVAMHSPQGREILERHYGLGGPDPNTLRQLGNTISASAGSFANAIAMPADRRMWVAEGERYLGMVERFSSSDDVTRSEQRRGVAVLRTARDRVTALFYEPWLDAAAESAVDAARVVGAHVYGLADDAERGAVTADDLRRPGAIAAGQAADDEFGATESAQLAARAEEARIRDYCDRPVEDWLHAAGRVLPDVGQADLTRQYEVTCKKKVPGLFSMVPWWVPAGIAAALVVGVAR